MTLRRPRLPLVLLLMAAASLALLPGSALAAITVTGGDAISISDGGAGDNVITITGTGGTYEVTDTFAPPVAGADCVATASPSTVSCSAVDMQASIYGLVGVDGVDVSTSDLQLVVQSGGSGRMTVRCGSESCTFYGSAGNDVVYGGEGSDYFLGKAGDDVIHTGGGLYNTVQDGAGDDVVLGGDGSDNVTCSRGADRIRGGAGSDT